MAGKKTIGVNQKGILMDFLWSLLVTAGSVILVVWIVINLMAYVRSQWQPTREIVVGAFTASAGGAFTNSAATAGSALGARLERLKRYARSEPTGFGLIRTPVLIAVPDQVREGRGAAAKRLEDLNLKVKDVDVNQVVKLVTSLLEPSRPVLAGTLTDYGDRLEVRAELSWKSRILDAWIAGRAKPSNATVADIDSILNSLYDDLLFQMIYDLPRNTKLHWFVGKDATPNWQTLEDMTLGLESLESYQRTLEYQDLQRSLNYLDRIPIHAPGFALGHFFLALALGEDRQEERAASVFGQIDGMSATTDLKWNARFQRASAMLRQYNGQAATDAADNLLKPLIAELQKTVDDKLKAGAAATEEQKSTAVLARQMLPLVQAQLAYTYGTMLTLKTQKTNGDLRKLAETAWSDANTAFQKVEEWPSGDNLKHEVSSWVLNAEGYSRFRVAQSKFEESTDAAEQKQAEFKKACDLALAKLREANVDHPNQYEILQNQAMILDDETYDPNGDHLEEAQLLYERTKRFVPRDYYQYERLARIYWRRAHEQTVISIKRDFITAGLENVVAAQRYRSGSRTAALCGAYFLLAAAAMESDQTKKNQNLLDAIRQAELTVSLEAQKASERKPIAKDSIQLMIAIATDLADGEKNKQTLNDLAAKFAK